MHDQRIEEPDSTAVRVALWRAMHLQVDAPPHIFEDELGLRLTAPGAEWRNRPDMDPQKTRFARAAIVTRARFVEDLVADQCGRGVDQYAILGAGLDTFAQRRPELASRMRVFELDRPSQLAWKQRRLRELGFTIPAWLRFAPVDFETDASWWEELVRAGFDTGSAATVTSIGVSMYVGKETVAATLRQLANLAPGSAVCMTFMLPIDMVAPEDERQHRIASETAAKTSGGAFISVFTPPEMLALAREAGFKSVEHISAADLGSRYFADRTDGLRLAVSEELFVART